MRYNCTLSVLRVCSSYQRISICMGLHEVKCASIGIAHLERYVVNCFGCGDNEPWSIIILYFMSDAFTPYEIPHSYSRVTLRPTVSQYVLVSSQLCGRLTRYCLGLEFVFLSLWGALSDERSGLSFVSHSLVICLCIHSLLTFLCFTHIYHIYIYIYIYIYCTLYTRPLLVTAPYSCLCRTTH
jgi:hypothetical protein